MTKPNQPASKEALNYHEAQSTQHASIPLVKGETNFNRDELSSLISLHITILFGKALEQDIDGFVNIRLFKQSKSINKFYQLKTIFTKIGEIADLVILNKTYNIAILPVLCDREEAKIKNLIGVGTIYFDFDYGDIQANADKAVSILGEPSLLVRSGGKTEENQQKIHCYWKLDKFITGNQEIKNFFSAKKEFAVLVGADSNFEKASQIARLLGTINQKYDTPCTLQQANKNIYNTQDLLDKMANYVDENKPLQEKICKSTDKQNQLSYIEKDFDEEKFVSLADVEITLAKYNVGKIINVFGCLDYQKWHEVVIALANNFNGDEIGYKLALDWSLTDSTRSPDEIVKSVEIEYKKDRKNHPNPITFRTIIKKANDLQLVLDNTALVEKYGRPIDIKAINDNEKYILTENKLLYTIKKRTGLKIFELCNFIQLLGYGTGSEGQLFLEILTKNFKGNYVKSILQQSLKSDELLLRLQDKQLCVDTINFSYLRRYLSIFKADKEIGILSKSGWDAVDWKSYEDFPDNWDKNGSFNLLYLDRVDSYPLNNSGDCVKNYLEFKGVNLKEYLDLRGSFTGWQNNIVKYAVNNDLVSFTLFTAFSAMFYTPLKTRSAIYHFFGESSQGKSVLLDIAMSVMGFAVNEGNPSGYIKWSATENGLEGLCAAKNDMLLCLDELTAVSDPKLIYNAAYMIVNGQGKIRASSRGTGYGNRVTKNWKTTAISTGEVPLRQKLEESGQEVMGGQEARFLDIPSVMDIFGVFNELHGFKTSYDLVKHFEEQSANYKGFAIKEFLKYVTINNKFSDILKEFRRLKTLWFDSYFETITDINTNQLKSVADNFAFVAAAGELAIKGGIFADYFKEWDAFKIVNNVFRRYLENLGDYTVTSEERKIVRNLKDFLRQKIAVAFWERPKENPFNSNTILKSDNQGWFGYKEDSNFYLLIDRVVEICGFNAEKVFNVLKKKNIILKDKNIKNDKPISYKYRLRFRPYGDSARPYFYLLDLSALGMADYLTDDNFPDPTSPEPTDKLKDLPCDSISSSSNIEPALVNTDSSNSSSVSNTTAVESNVNSTFKPKWRVRERNELLDYLERYYQEGRKITYFAFQTSDLREWDKFSLHELNKPLFAIGIKGELDTKPQLFRIRNVRLTQLERETLIKCIFREAVIRQRCDLLSYLQTYDNLSLNFSFKAIDEDFAKPEHIQELYFEGQFDNQVQIFKLDNGYLSESEQSAWSRVKCVWTDKHYPTTKENFYFPFNCYDYCSIAFEYWFPFLKENIKAAISQRLKVKVQKNYIMRSREDLASISVGCFQEYVMCAGIVEGGEKTAEKLRYLLLKKKNEKPIVIKLENGLTKEEQEILKPLELVFSKINMDTEQYLPNLNYNWVHFLDIALLTRNTDTKLIQTLKEPFYILQENTEIEELLSVISNDLLKNQDIFSRIELEVLNEFRYRDTIINEYDTLKHVPY